MVEADVLLDRGPLEADPATALAQTSAVTTAIDRIGPGQGYVIDNISNALAVASVDAATGRRMFLFLGLPGALLAAFLAAFAASILAATERREQAILRVRGADRRHLRTIALTKSLAIACVGSTAGVLLGLLSTAIILGASTVFAATTAELIRSAILSATFGLVVTAIALYVPARRSIGREVSEQRRALRDAPSPLWRRYGLDVALVVAAVVLEIAAVRGGTLDPPAGSVYSGTASLADEPAVDPRPRVGGRVAPVRTAPRRPRIARARAGAPFRTGRSRCLGSEPPSSRGRSRRRHPGARPHRCLRNRVGVVRRDVRCSEGRRHAVHPGLRHPDHAERPRDRSAGRRRCVRVPRPRCRRRVARRLRSRERGHDRAAQPATREPRGDRPLDLLGGRAVARSGLRRGDRGGRAGRVGCGPARGSGG